MDRARTKPDWSRLFKTAEAQEGYFTTSQAAQAGYSSQLLVKHLRAGRVIRVRRGVYRLVHFPAGEHEDLVVIWLWSKLKGVVSHQTALFLHDLSDALPSRVHLTLPTHWKQRRLKVPKGVALQFADVLAGDRTWFGAVPTTTPRRSLNDCAQSDCSPELLQQAARQAIRRGLVTEEELVDVKNRLAAFGGLVS